MWTEWMSFLPCSSGKHGLTFQSSSSTSPPPMWNWPLINIPTILDCPDFRKSYLSWHFQHLAKYPVCNKWSINACWMWTIEWINAAFCSFLICHHQDWSFELYFWYWEQSYLASHICKTTVQGWGCSWYCQTGGCYSQFKKQTPSLGVFPTKELIGADEIAINGPSKDS